MVHPDGGSAGEPFAARANVASSDALRERFGYVDGLRAFAVACVVVGEVVRLAPGLTLGPPAAMRAALAGLHGADLFFVLSGFALAYPALALARQDGRSYLDVARYAVKRAARILPAYWVVLALAWLLPAAGARYGVTGLGAPPDPHHLARLAMFADAAPENDGFASLALVARWYLVFPLLLGLWGRAPRAFLLLLVGVWTAGLLTPLHALGASVLPAFMLGIVAADVRAQHHRFERWGLAFALAGIVLGAFEDPWFSALPAVRGSSWLLGGSPFWQLAAFGVVIAAGALRPLERVLSLRVLALLGGASYAIALVAVPVETFVLRQATPTLGVETAALNAAVVAAAVGLALWQAVDRWFGDGPLRRQLADVVAPVARVPLAILHADRVPLADPHLRRMTEPVAEESEPAVPPAFYAPPPRPTAADLAIVVQRTGTPDELAAEIHAAKARLAERSTKFFAAQSFRDEPDEPPGFYERPSQPAALEATPVAATSVAATSVAATPLAATPAAATPVAATPVAATSVAATPVAATPVTATPDTTASKADRHGAPRAVTGTSFALRPEATMPWTATGAQPPTHEERRPPAPLFESVVEARDADEPTRAASTNASTDAYATDAYVADAHTTGAHMTDAYVADAHATDARTTDAHVTEAPVTRDAGDVSTDIQPESLEPESSPAPEPAPSRAGVRAPRTPMRLRIGPNPSAVPHPSRTNGYAQHG